MLVDPIEAATMLNVLPSVEDFRPYNKMLDLASRTSSRTSSPQPTQLTFHNGSGSRDGSGSRNGSGSRDRRRAVRTSTVGYIAPKFEGKKAQMVEGQYGQDIEAGSSSWASACA
jgi:hypothetical protein